MTSIGVQAIEKDYSHYVAYASKTVLAIVGTASKGPVNEAIAVTSTQDLVNKFGTLKEGYHGLYAAQYFLSQSSKLYFVRSAGDTLAPAQVTISGKDAAGTSDIDSIVIEMKEKGTFSNGYKLIVESRETKDGLTYNLTLKTAGTNGTNGTTLEAFKGLTFDNISTALQSNYFVVKSSDPQTATLTDGDYPFKGGNDGILDDLPLTSARLTILGKGKDGTDLTDAVLIEMKEKGKFSNGYIVSLSTPDNGTTYDLELITAEGTVLEVFEGLTINDFNTSLKSNYFAILSVNPQLSELTGGDYVFSKGEGAKGIQAGDYVNAINTLAAEQVDINLLAVPGVSESPVILAALTVAENRGDCLYIIDPPKGLTRDGVINWVNGSGEYTHAMFNSSYGAVYYDWVKIYDTVNKKSVEVPPSVVVCPAYAYSDRNSEVWYAPAGLNRGIVRGVMSPVTSLSKVDTDLLYEANINSIYENPQVGLVLWGQKTLQRTDTALDRVNVRRLMNYLKKIISAACQRLVFEPNDRITWNSFEMMVLPILKGIKNRRGIYEYKIVKGETIVTEEDIDNYRMPCMILVRPTKAAEEIPIYFVITSTGADFNEVLEANGVVNE